MATRQSNRGRSQQEPEHFFSVITELGEPFEVGDYTGMDITFEDGTTGTNWTKDPDKYHDPIQQAFEEGTEVEYSAEEGQKGLKIRVYFPQEEAKPQRRSSSGARKSAASSAPRARVSAQEDKPARKAASSGGRRDTNDDYWRNKFEYEKAYAPIRDYAIQCQEWGKILAPFFVTAQQAAELSLEKAVTGLHKAVAHAMKTYGHTEEEEG